VKINLQKLRREKKWSRNKLAILSGVSRSYISQIEKGEYSNVGAEILCKLCKALGCTIDELLECEVNEND
jgi:transcriptional regulator with XRE-family HTH domain